MSWARRVAPVALAVSAVACGGESTSLTVARVAPTTTDPPPPAGWWTVVTASPGDEVLAPGTAWRFRARECEIARAPDLVERLAVGLHGNGADTWRTDTGRTDIFEIHNEPLTLTMRIAPTRSTPAREVAFRLSTVEEAAAAERALAQHGTLDAVCGRAAVCFKAAALALSHDDQREMAPGTSLRNCERIIAGYGSLFASLGRDVPEACARDASP
jgi:hypothetical protein